MIKRVFMIVIATALVVAGAAIAPSMVSACTGSGSSPCRSDSVKPPAL